jgi:hypothetical protein
MLRRIMLGALAVALPVGLLTVVVAPNLAAAAPLAKTMGTGTYKCSDITGTITFSPPLTLSSKGTVTETLKIKSKSTGCTGGSPAVVSGTGSEKAAQTGKGLGNCKSLSNGKAAEPDIITKYSNGASDSTTIGGAESMTAPNGNLEFVITDATVTGSYPSKKADITSVLSENEDQIGAQCESPSGLSKLTISSGTSSHI